MGTDPFFEFLDPMDCLLHCYRELKKREPGVSHRYITASLGLKSSGTFALIMRGKFHPSPGIVDGLARIFKLDADKRDHLALLLEIRRMKHPSARRLAQNLVRSMAVRSHLNHYNAYKPVS
jgi:hypothetical protein